MKLLITGGLGFLGSNLSSYALKNNYDLYVFDNLSRKGSIDNLRWLKTIGQFEFIQGDIRNIDDVQHLISAVKPDFIFHLAGQVAMTTSIEKPLLDFEINVKGTINLLETIRNICPKCPIVFSSTNKVYGDLNDLTYKELEKRYSCVEYPSGFSEDINLEFKSPYGVSKGSADQYMIDYAETFNLKTVVLRHSSMYGGRQFSTYDQGWISWFCKMAIMTKRDPSHTFDISGNGKQVRDILHEKDMTNLYYQIVNNIDICKGQVFNIGGGIDNSMSLLELFKFLNNKLDISLNYTCKNFRKSDQLFFVSSNKKISELLGWEPEVSVTKGLDLMIDWISNNE